MTRSVALLRGINVGGRSKVEMPRLRASFEAIGCRDVSTYINSGNVLFEDDREPAELGPAIEAALAHDLGLDLRVLLRTGAELRALCQAIPGDWTNDDRCKTDVLFLAGDLDPRQVVEAIDRPTGRERVLELAGAVVWSIDREHIRPGQGARIAGSALVAQVTARNVNTVRKLDALANG